MKTAACQHHPYLSMSRYSREILSPAPVPPLGQVGPGHAPFCPLMTLGWSMLASYVDLKSLHPAVIDASRFRLNSEWTTFREQDVRWMLSAFEKGELQ